MIHKLKKLGLLYRVDKMLHVRKDNPWGYLTYNPVYSYKGIGYAPEAYYSRAHGEWRPDKDHNKLKKELHLWL